MFCKHKWKHLHVHVVPSAIEVAQSVGCRINKGATTGMLIQVHKIYNTSTECGKLKVDTVRTGV